MKLVVAFIAIALVWSFGAALTGDVLGWNPLVATVGTVLLVGTLGWLQRGHDVVEVFGHATIVAYAAFMGLAFARVITTFDQDRVMWYGSPVHPGLPGLLLAGIAYALVLSVSVAIPVSRVPARHGRAAQRDEQFLTFIGERAHTPRDPAGPSP